MSATSKRRDKDRERPGAVGREQQGGCRNWGLLKGEAADPTQIDDTGEKAIHASR